MDNEAEYDYREEFPQICLGMHGSLTDFDTEADALGKVWNRTFELLARQGSSLPFPADITQAEIRRAWKLWLQSHHSFFCCFILLSYCYQHLQKAANNSDSANIGKWASRVSSLWSGSGALMLYGCDFQPTAAIYCNYIRTKMPGAFSGFWLREWVPVYESSMQWQMIATSSTNPDIIAADSVASSGLKAYHKYHNYVMRAAVPDGESLAREYQKLNGCKHSITETEFTDYDDWFRVRRMESQTRMEFSEVACQAFSDTLDELLKGHRLDEAVIRDIVKGIQTAICIFGEWLGPIPETSKYFPRNMRGE